MKKLISIMAVFGLAFATFNASAISAKYRAQLERSGCDMQTASNGCDIHKTKAQNAAKGFKEVDPQVESAKQVAKFAGNYGIYQANGQRIADLAVKPNSLITINGAKVEGYFAEAGKLNIFEGTQHIILTSNKGGTWKNPAINVNGTVHK